MGSIGVAANGSWSCAAECGDHSHGRAGGTKNGSYDVGYEWAIYLGEKCTGYKCCRHSGGVFDSKVHNGWKSHATGVVGRC